MKHAALPVLQSTEELVTTAVCLKSPAVVLTEAGRNLSVVLCESVESGTIGELHLRECRWVWFRPEFIGILPLAEVVVCTNTEGFWEMRDASSGRLLPGRGKLPYFVQFLSAEGKRSLDEMLERLQTRTFLDAIFAFFRDGPCCTIAEEGRLQAPKGYGDSPVSAAEQMPIPAEFRVS
jgi:hypothetical protein